MKKTGIVAFISLLLCATLWVSTQQVAVPVAVAQNVDIDTSQPPVVVNSSSNLGTLTVHDGRIIIIRTGSAAGLMYYSASSSATVDDVDVINGPGGVGRYLRLAGGAGAAALADVANKVADVTALLATSPSDNQLYQTLGYSTEGVGANLYRYDATSMATIDGGFVLPGPGGTLSFSGTTFDGDAGDGGRFIAVDQSAVWSTQFGLTFSGDESSVIQRAINSCAGKTLLLSPGTAHYGTTLELPSNVCIRGCGPTISILNYTGSSVAIGRVSGVTTGVLLESFSITGTDGNGGVGLELDSFSRSQFINILINMFRNAGDTGVGLKMQCTDGVCAFNYFQNLEVSNSDDALVMDSTNASHSTGYNTFNRLVIGTEVRGIRLLQSLANGSMYNQFFGVFLQNSGTTTHCIEIEGQGNIFTDVTIDVLPSTYELDLSSSANGNFLRFLTALTMAKYRNLSSTGAPNIVTTQTQSLGSPGKPVIIQDDLQELDVDFRSGGTNKAIEVHYGNSTNTRQWTYVCSGHAGPYWELKNNTGQTIYRAEQEGNLSLFGSVESGGGVGVLSVRDCSTAPSTNPATGGVLFSEGGALKWRGSSGTVTTIANP